MEDQKGNKMRLITLALTTVLAVMGYGTMDVNASGPSNPSGATEGAGVLPEKQLSVAERKLLGEEKDRVQAESDKRATEAMHKNMAMSAPPAPVETVSAPVNAAPEDDLDAQHTSAAAAHGKAKDEAVQAKNAEKEAKKKLLAVIKAKKLAAKMKEKAAKAVEKAKQKAEKDAKKEADKKTKAEEKLKAQQAKMAAKGAAPEAETGAGEDQTPPPLPTSKQPAPPVTPSSSLPTTGDASIAATTAESKPAKAKTHPTVQTLPGYR